MLTNSNKNKRSGKILKTRLKISTKKSRPPSPSPPYPLRVKELERKSVTLHTPAVLFYRILLSCVSYYTIPFFPLSHPPHTCYQMMETFRFDND